eukprot:2462339-Pleurochrysis_carterae.AAC.1
MPLRRRRLVGPLGADPLCAYDALRMAWLAREAEVPTAQRTPGRPSQIPFFTDDGGTSAWTTT